MSQRYSTEQWREWIEEQVESGLSIAAFCDSIGVSANAFYYRRRRLAEKSGDRESRAHSGAAVDAAAAGFVGIRLAADPQRPVVEVDLGGAVCVRVYEPRVVGEVLEVCLSGGASE